MFTTSRTRSNFEVSKTDDGDSSGSNSNYVFGDISDEMAETLAAAARPAFESARNAYWAGLPGPRRTPFRVTDSTGPENGLAIEIAYGNETFPELYREIVNWTSGDGNRALLAVGIKINTKPPYQRDAQLRLVVRDSTPTFPSANCQVYDFGNGSNIAPRGVPQPGPPTPVIIASESPVEGCQLQYLVPDDPQAEEMIVDLPIGAALFHDLQADVQNTGIWIWDTCATKSASSLNTMQPHHEPVAVSTVERGGQGQFYS
ncbi:hypothetical protein B0H17DRAFT_1132377 [Mycena rosella]|uniref:Uncharacterized protein n=1 Tax=Mycena rosella TaxID=1033263 RepID=A0AAD7DKR0_MYCRO|nr:hypothetical protein B0H17DRAFT_1132377 [Mycena rosella]